MSMFKVAPAYFIRTIFCNLYTRYIVRLYMRIHGRVNIGISFEVHNRSTTTVENAATEETTTTADDTSMSPNSPRDTTQSFEQTSIGTTCISRNDSAFVKVFD